jgi:hypothetical protein
VVGPRRGDGWYLATEVGMWGPQWTRRANMHNSQQMRGASESAGVAHWRHGRLQTTLAPMSCFTRQLF